MMFKSARSAKMAYTKATRAWEAKRAESHAAASAIYVAMSTEGSMSSDDYRAYRATEERCDKEAAELYDAMRAIYDAATAQGFYVSPWHFGENATRDLIAANMD